MKNYKKGFIVPLVVIIVLVLIIGGVYYYQKKDVSVENNETNTTNSAAFTNNVYGLSFDVPEGYLILSNHFEESDPAKAAAFMFREESESYVGVPTLSVKEANGSTDKDLGEFAQSVYDLNKTKSTATTNIKKTSLAGIEAYTFNLGKSYYTSESSKLLDSEGGKVVFLSHNGKIVELLLTGSDSGLGDILDSARF